MPVDRLPRPGPRRHRVPILAAACAAWVLAACTGAPRDPTRFLQPRDGTGQIATGNGLGALVGTWQTVIVIALDVDLQRWTTTWRFDADGACHFTREVLSIAEGVPRTVERRCAWTVTGATILATFADNGERHPLPWSFAAFGTTTLILEGIAYQRVGR